MSLFNSLCHRLCLYISVHKSEKQAKLCLPGSHYQSSFRELSKSIWIVFLFQNVRESCNCSFIWKLLKCAHRSYNSPRKFINVSMLLVSCTLLVVNYCKGQSGVTNFDFSRGYQNIILKNKENL